MYYICNELFPNYIESFLIIIELTSFSTKQTKTVQQKQRQLLTNFYAPVMQTVM